MEDDVLFYIKYERPSYPRESICANGLIKGAFKIVH